MNTCLMNTQACIRQTCASIDFACTFSTNKCDACKARFTGEMTSTQKPFETEMPPSANKTQPSKRGAASKISSLRHG